jgi:hypothetical protein
MNTSTPKKIPNPTLTTNKHTLIQLASLLIIFILMTLWFQLRTPAQKRKRKINLHKKRLVRRLRAKQ